jgi:hypothetical protein
MRVTIPLFNAGISFIKDDVFVSAVKGSEISEVLKKKMLLYRTMVINNHDSLDKIFTKDLKVIALLLELLGYIHIESKKFPESLDVALLKSIEESEKNDTEGEYLVWCNRTLKIKKLFETLADYPYAFNPDTMLIDNVWIWFPTI